LLCVCLFISFFSSLRLPPRSPLFPYTTLFRSVWQLRDGVAVHRQVKVGVPVEIFIPHYIPFHCKLPAFIHHCADVLAYSRKTGGDRKSTRLNSSHVKISYAVFCSKKKKNSRKN